VSPVTNVWHGKNLVLVLLATAALGLATPAAAAPRPAKDGGLCALLGMVLRL
jgi:hypothetical protein